MDNKKIYDCHLYMGKITDKDEISPRELREFLNKMGVAGGMAMPVARPGGVTPEILDSCERYFYAEHFLDTSKIICNV